MDGSPTKLFRPATVSSCVGTEASSTGTTTVGTVDSFPWPSVLCRVVPMGGGIELETSQCMLLKS